MGLPLRYNCRNLLRRKLRTCLTILGIALVIATSVMMMAYSRGLLLSTRSNGDADNVMILSRRATDTTFSSLEKAQVDVLSGMLGEEVVWWPPEDEVAEGEYRVDLIAPYVGHTFLIRVAGVEGGRYGERKLGLVKGIDPQRAFSMRHQLRLAAGRKLDPDDEKAAMVGSMVWARLGIDKADVGVGKVLEFNGVAWPIVGVFDAGGSDADGEIWVPIDELLTVLNRTVFNYAIAKAPSPEGVAKMVQIVNRSDQTELRAVSEKEYYRGFAESFDTFALIGLIMALIISVGGLTVGMNTMYTAISGRVREIGMLQVIGFSKGSILVSVLVESLLIALLGGALGCAAGSLVNGIPMKVTMGVFLLRADALVVGLGMGLALLIGFFGALVPARSALKLGKVEAMRYA
ncbi:MAG: ABC transporter permease [Planctomycetota bacterium]|jgi:ABC-type antimicrobial peptide transport system permease subunit